MNLLCIIMLSCFSFMHRNSSAPYISGDTFRSFADWIIDETHLPFDPKAVKRGDVIFVKTDYLNHLLGVYTEIAAPYILVTHNSDGSAPGYYWLLLEDEKLIAWFAQNVDGVHPKLHPLPIGLANRYWPHGDVAIFDQIKSEEWQKTIFLYLNFTPHTYPQERGRVYKQFIRQPYCTSSPSKDLYAYLTDLKQSRFVLSPRGNGLDTHRTWEGLYMGAIPIVRSSLLDPLYEGLPVVIVQKWEEVTEEFLEQKWKEMQGKQWNFDKLSAAYWFDLIRLLSKR